MQAEGADLYELGCGHGDARADDDEVLAAEGEQAVGAGFDHEAFVEEHGELGDEGCGAGVGDGDAGAALFEEARGGEAAFAEAYYEYAFVF